MIFLTQFIAALALFETCLLRSSLTETWPIIVLCWIANVGCVVSISCSYTITKELFPTPLRTTALGLTSAFARLGSISSPFIDLLSVYFMDGLSLAIFGSFLLLGSVCSILIWPETKDQKMSESIEECEELAKGKNKWIVCTHCCSETKD